MADALERLAILLQLTSSVSYVFIPSVSCFLDGCTVHLKLVGLDIYDSQTDDIGKVGLLLAKLGGRNMCERERDRDREREKVGERERERERERDRQKVEVVWSLAYDIGMEKCKEILKFCISL